jgi:hypothetical protein
MQEITPDYFKVYADEKGCRAANQDDTENVVCRIRDMSLEKQTPFELSVATPALLSPVVTLQAGYCAAQRKLTSTRAAKLRCLCAG